MEIKIDAASRTVTLNIDGTFTSEQLAELLKTLAKARAEVSADPRNPVGLALDVVPNGYWYCDALAIDRTVSLLILYLGGFGWQGITMDTESRRGLIQQLMTLESFAIDGPGATVGPPSGH